MDIVELYCLVEGLGKLSYDELNTTRNAMSKLQKKNEEQYNEILEQIFFIKNKIDKLLDIKCPPEPESDHEPHSFDSDSDDEIRSYDIRLVDVYSDEE